MPGQARRTSRPAPKAEKQFPVDDEQFTRLADEVKAHGRTMLPRKRLWMLWQCVGNVAPLEGGAAEIGAYQGGSAYFIAASFATRLGHEVPLEVIDTFAGHPPGKLSGHDSPVHADETKFAATSYESVVEYLGAFEQVTVRQGDFSTSLPSYRSSATVSSTSTWTSTCRRSNVSTTSARASSRAGSSSSTITASPPARESAVPRRSFSPRVDSRRGTP